jgi:hypothetical protein
MEMNAWQIIQAEPSRGERFKVFEEYKNQSNKAAKKKEKEEKTMEEWMVYS